MDEKHMMTLRVSDEIYNQLNVKAAKEKLTVSDLVRRYIEKGLSVDGYKSEIEFLSEIMKTELGTVIEPQINRIVKLIMKLGKINGAGYFLLLANLINTSAALNVDDLSETVQRCNRLALGYMSQNDSDVGRYLENNQQLMKEALKIKNEYGFDIDDIFGSDDKDSDDD